MKSANLNVCQPSTITRTKATMKRRARGPIPSQDKLAHELQVHQFELEMQNDALCRAHVNLAAARDRSVGLCDFALVGYLTLDTQEVVKAANPTNNMMCKLAETDRRIAETVHDAREAQSRQLARQLHDGLAHDAGHRLDRAHLRGGPVEFASAAGHQPQITARLPLLREENP